MKERRMLVRFGVLLVSLVVAVVAVIGTAGASPNQSKYVLGRLEHARRQRLARGDDLRDQGPGALERQGLEGDRREPERRPGRAERGHPQPDLRRRQRDHHQPLEPERAQRHDRAGCGPRDQGGLARPARDGTVRLQRHERPGRLRAARRGVAVQAARRQGQRRRDARNRRSAGRHRPPHRLPAGAEEVSGNQGRQADLHRLVVRARRQADPGHPQLGRAGGRRLDFGDRLRGRERVQDRGQAVRAGRRCRQQRVPQAADHAEPEVRGRRGHESGDGRRRGCRRGHPRARWRDGSEVGQAHAAGVGHEDVRQDDQAVLLAEAAST